MSRTIRKPKHQRTQPSDNHWERIKARTRRLAQKLMRRNPEATTAECRALHKKARGLREWSY